MPVARVRRVVCAWARGESQKVRAEGGEGERARESPRASGCERARGREGGRAGGREGGRAAGRGMPGSQCEPGPWVYLSKPRTTTPALSILPLGVPCWKRRFRPWATRDAIALPG